MTPFHRRPPDLMRKNTAGSIELEPARPASPIVIDDADTKTAKKGGKRGAAGGVVKAAKVAKIAPDTSAPVAAAAAATAAAASAAAVAPPGPSVVGLPLLSERKSDPDMVFELTGILNHKVRRTARLISSHLISSHPLTHGVSTRPSFVRV